MKFKYLYLLLILTFMSSCNNTQENNSKEIKGKIVHSVYFWLNDPQNQDDVKTFENNIKGELTIVISEGDKKVQSFDEEKIVNKVKIYLKKYSLKDTVNLISEIEKINKKKIYKLCLKIKNEKII